MPSINSGRHHNNKRGFPLQGVFFILLLVVASYALMNSSFFAVTKLSVTGNNQLKQENIIKMTGISPGINIFKVSINDIEEKVQLHPLIKTATVKRVLPREIKIILKERVGQGLLPRGSNFAVIDAEGVYLYELTSINKTNLPIITGVKMGQIKVGETVNSVELGDALYYLSVMRPEISALVSEINCSDSENIIAYTIDGIEIRLGNREKATEKLRIYEEVVSQKYAEKIQYIDLSYESKPVVKFLSEQK